MRLDTETGSHHGVYVVGAGDQVYTYLQKPTAAEVKGAGGLLEDGRVAVDIGLLRFDADLTTALAELARFSDLPAVDLYDQITRGMTGQWKPENGAGLFWQSWPESCVRRSARVGFHCAMVNGEFIHAGTTRSFRALMANSGGILDSAIGGACRAGHEAVILECDLAGPVIASRGAILHGLTGLSGPVEVPEDTVVHQLPVEEAGDGGWVIRAYGVEDDPKQPIENATWFNQPFLETLERLGIRREELWDTDQEQALWNAALFPVTTPDEAWICARWMMGYASGYSVERWRSARRLSLSGSARCADGKALAEARNHRLQSIWQYTAVELAQSGADLRPLLANLPGLAPAAAAGHLLRNRAEELRKGNRKDLTLAASHLVQAARLLGRAGLEQEADSAESDAFICIQDAVREGGVDESEQIPDTMAVGTRSCIGASANRSGRRLVGYAAILF